MQNQTSKKQTNFFHAEIDPLGSTYMMQMYRTGFQHPNTFYSKKKDNAEPDNKEYVLMGMIQRLVYQSNCFERKEEEIRGKVYAPATLVEFYRKFDNETENTLILRLYPKRFESFDYLADNVKVNAKIQEMYEALRIGNAELVLAERRSLANDEKKDFHWKYMSIDAFDAHSSTLYSKYNQRGRVELYEQQYLKLHYPHVASIRFYDPATTPVVVPRRVAVSAEEYTPVEVPVEQNSTANDESPMTKLAREKARQMVAKSNFSDNRNGEITSISDMISSLPNP